MLSLKERPETCLGYGGSGTSGSSRSEETREKVLRTATEIIKLGERDPEIISLMGMFEEDVGPDTISDIATAAIMPALGELTEAFCATVAVQTRTFPNYENRALPENPFRPSTPVMLVPRDVLRDLPLAADWYDVSRVVMEIDEIRDSFNRQIGGIIQASVGEKKQALKAAALSSLKNFKALFATILESSDHYDPQEDVLGFYAFRALMGADLSAFAEKVSPQKTKSKAELRRVVGEIVEYFKFAVEKNNMWELLWHGQLAKRERASQLLFFAVADMCCRANNIDISPETHSGGGPVDFKFSSGYQNRLLVEVKLSKGQVVHGYKKQLETYKTAARTDAGIFLVVNVGGMGRKLMDITKHRDAKLAAGEIVSDIVVVDARRKTSASRDQL